MTALTFVALSAAGGLGAVLRVVLDGIIRSSTRLAFPLGTTVINVSGSLVLGFVVAVAGAGLMSEELRLIVGVGFLGGYTTFSTASFEAVRLVQDRRYRAALTVGPGMLVLGIAAAAAGLGLGSLA